MNLSNVQGKIIRCLLSKSVKYGSENVSWKLILSPSHFGYFLFIREFQIDVQRQQKQQNGKWNNIGGESSNRRSSTTLAYYVKLAPESPLGKSHYELCHDESSYDSFHNWETGKQWKFPNISNNSSHVLKSNASSSIFSLETFPPSHLYIYETAKQNLVRTCSAIISLIYYYFYYIILLLILKWMLMK
jgi:hypothetical protein